MRWNAVLVILAVLLVLDAVLIISRDLNFDRLNQEKMMQSASVPRTRKEAHSNRKSEATRKDRTPPPEDVAEDEEENGEETEGEEKNGNETEGDVENGHEAEDEEENGNEAESEKENGNKAEGEEENGNGYKTEVEEVKGDEAKGEEEIGDEAEAEEKEGETNETGVQNGDTNQHKVAGLNCDAYGGPSEKDAAEMVYWQDIPSDANYVSPLKAAGPEVKYLTFEPDEGGWNNIRMSMETAVTLAHATGRILVMPPEQGMYLLHKGDKQQKNRFSFSDFFHFDSVAAEHAGVEVISMEEFLKREVMTGHAKNKATGLVTFPPRNRTNWDGAARNEAKELDLWMRTFTDNPKWPFDTCLVGLPAKPGSTKHLLEMGDKVTAVNFEVRINNFTGNPVPVDAAPIDRLSEMFGGRSSVYWKADVWNKRFVRDHLRYVDEIQCAAARVVKAMRQKAREHGNEDGIFDTFHIRRGDFQYKDTRVDAPVIYENMKHLIPEGTTIYIATDERDKRFFKIFHEHFNVYFLDDFAPILEGVNTNFYGMLDQRVASRGRTFIGCFYSTFTGYINRMRGYHSQMDKAEGWEQGVINSWYYIPKSRINALREYRPIAPAMWSRVNFPLLGET
ncbi:GDP-fucose protein O-fucosyltransferase [Fragilaria crotonensis]|nr:GDP-fucose protein O-fucosyltransferase [Fragilaria crotonensis]